MDRRILAQAYTNSAADTMHQRPPVLLDLLAQRLDGMRLGQVSDHFGFEPVYAAVWRQAQHKSMDFERAANVNARPPTAGGATAIYRPMQFRPQVTMTIGEIYSGFRTAPVGGLSINGALYETAMFAGGRIVAAFYAGSWAGQQLVTFIQNNYPDRWDALGANVSYVMNGFQNIYATTPAGSGQNTQLGNLQSSAAPGFNLNPTEYLLLGGGGDYGVTQE